MTRVTTTSILALCLIICSFFVTVIILVMITSLRTIDEQTVWLHDNMNTYTYTIRPLSLTSNIKSISQSLNGTIKKNIFGEILEANYDDFIYNTKLVTLSNYGYRRFTLNLIKSIDNLTFEKQFTLYIMTMDNKCINYFNCIRLKSYHNHNKKMEKYCSNEFSFIPTIKTNIVVINITQTTIDTFNRIGLNLNQTIINNNISTFKNGSIKNINNNMNMINKFEYIDKLKKIQLNWNLNSKSNTKIAKLKTPSYAVISSLGKLCGLRYLIKDIWNYSKNIFYLDSDISIINSHIQHFVFDFVYLSKANTNLFLRDLSIYNQHHLHNNNNNSRLVKANIYNDVQFKYIVNKAVKFCNLNINCSHSHSHSHAALKARNRLIMGKAVNRNQARGCAGIIFIESNKNFIDQMFNIEKYWGFEFDTNDQMYINMYNERYYTNSITQRKQNITGPAISKVITSGVIDFFPTSAFASGRYLQTTLIINQSKFHDKSYLGHFNGFPNVVFKINAMRQLNAWHLGDVKETSKY